MDNMYDPRPADQQTIIEALDVIKRNTVACISTSAQDWPSQVATVFYATKSGNTLFSKFTQASDHGKAISNDQKISLAIYDNGSSYLRKEGIQARALCRKIGEKKEMQEAMELYAETFPGSRNRFLHVEEMLKTDVKSTLYRIDIVSLKLVSPKGFSVNYEQLNQC